jgi:hypothetical protein
MSWRTARFFEPTNLANRADGLRQEFELGTFRIKARLFTTFVTQKFQTEMLFVCLKDACYMPQYLRFSAQSAAVTVTPIQFVLQTLETRGFHFSSEHVTAGMRSGDRGVCDLAADRFTDTTAKRTAATLTQKLTQRRRRGAAATYGQTFKIHEWLLCVQSIRAFQMELYPIEAKGTIVSFRNFLRLFNCP